LIDQGDAACGGELLVVAVHRHDVIKGGNRPIGAKSGVFMKVNWGFFTHALEVGTPDFLGKQSRPANIHAIEIADPGLGRVFVSIQVGVHRVSPDQHAVIMPEYKALGESWRFVERCRLTDALIGAITTALPLTVDED
jgi:hypothetical protein